MGIALFTREVEDTATAVFGFKEGMQAGFQFHMQRVYRKTLLIFMEVTA
jgi:hypothetical protein